MNCEEAQDRILEGLDASEHVHACASCSELATLHEGLARAFKAPRLSSDFRSRLHLKVSLEKKQARWDWLPDVATFAAGGVATALCTLLVPLPAELLIAGGTALTLSSYVTYQFLASLLEGTD
jgi:hypothetical protein